MVLTGKLSKFIHCLNSNDVIILYLCILEPILNWGSQPSIIQANWPDPHNLNKHNSTANQQGY